MPKPNNCLVMVTLLLCNSIASAAAITLNFSGTVDFLNTKAVDANPNPAISRYYSLETFDVFFPGLSLSLNPNPANSIITVDGLMVDNNYLGLSNNSQTPSSRRHINSASG